MIKINKHDFVEIDFVAKIKNTGTVFDLTIEEVAKENGLYDQKRKYGPIIICVGENFLLAGIDKYIINKTIGKHSFDLAPEEAFGKKNPKLIRLVSINVFVKQKINPFPGLHVSVDGNLGIIRSVSGGRCVVDFNHPLSGRELTYEINILRIVDEKREKLSCLCRFLLNLDNEQFEIIETNNTIEMKLKSPHKIPDDIIAILQNKAHELIINLGELKLIQNDITTPE